MKARTLVSMLLIIAISFTGFGFTTTADLTENSTAISFNQSDDVKSDLVKVVDVEDVHFDAVLQNIMKLRVEKFFDKFLDREVHIEKFYKEYPEVDVIPPDLSKNRFVELFKEADNEFDLAYQDELTEMKLRQLKLLETISIDFYQKKRTRNPRDGLNCNS